jgi:hypothetical protein
MPSKVFISYRRDDAAGHAGRVHDRLEREFGADLLFMDVDAIPLGVNFTKVLREEVAKSSGDVSVRLSALYGTVGALEWRCPRREPRTDLANQAVS